MAKQQLQFLELTSAGALLQGAVGLQFNKLLGQAVADIQARPTDKKGRKITVQLELTPKTDGHFDERTKTTIHELTGVDVQFAFDIKVPKRQTIKIDCGVDANGRLVHNPHSPTNHAQTVFLGDDEAEALEARDRKSKAAGD
jgi:hypothetical protein